MALGLVFGALVGALFLAVLLVITGWGLSPIAGAVGDRSVRVGQYVQPGTQLMTIVPMRHNIYVVANYKETQIERMYRGEAVDLEIDTFPGVTLHGTVDSLAPGSGSQFARPCSQDHRAQARRAGLELRDTGRGLGLGPL